MAVTEQTERVAQMLHEAGWRSPLDAQWTILQAALPALRVELAEALESENAALRAELSLLREAAARGPVLTVWEQAQEELS